MTALDKEWRQTPDGFWHFIDNAKSILKAVCGVEAVWVAGPVSKLSSVPDAKACTECLGYASQVANRTQQPDPFTAAISKLRVVADRCDEAKESIGIIVNQLLPKMRGPEGDNAVLRCYEHLAVVADVLGVTGGAHITKPKGTASEVGITVIGLDSHGELELRLDIDGAQGAAFVSREFWTKVGSTWDENDCLKKGCSLPARHTGDCVPTDYQRLIEIYHWLTGIAPQHRVHQVDRAIELTGLVPVPELDAEEDTKPGKIQARPPGLIGRLAASSAHVPHAGEMPPGVGAPETTAPSGADRGSSDTCIRCREVRPVCDDGHET